MKGRLLLFLLTLLGLVGWGPFYAYSPIIEQQFGSYAWIQQHIRIFYAQARNIDPNVLRVSLTAYVKARARGLDDKQLLTIIDYSKPSDQRRMFVLDLKRDKVLFNTWVSHGRNSGDIHSTSFSNEPGSLKSSIGVFSTEEPYIGGNGYSLRLIGLEPGINDNAYRRDIVLHGAWYVDPEVARRYGRIGRSWGCPAVKQELAQPLIDTIKGNTLIVAYYNDLNWLSRSNFIAG